MTILPGKRRGYGCWPKRKRQPSTPPGNFRHVNKSTEAMCWCFIKEEVGTTIAPLRSIHFWCGGGVVYIHWAVDGRGQQDEMAKRIGLSALGGSIKYRHGPLKIDFSPGAGHPIARNFDTIHWIDESYWSLSGDPQRINLLGTSAEDGQPQSQFWTLEHGRGRVFVSIPGHYSWTFDDPVFRTLLLRGIAWAGHRDVDRFNEIVTVEARVQED